MIVSKLEGKNFEKFFKNRGKKGVKSGKISRCVIVFFRVFGEMAKKRIYQRDDDIYIDGIRLLSHT